MGSLRSTVRTATRVLARCAGAALGRVRLAVRASGITRLDDDRTLVAMVVQRWADAVELVAEGEYRYRLLRAGPGGRGGRRLVVIGLNPSDAGQRGSRTTRRFASSSSGHQASARFRPPKTECFQEVLYVNLFAWRHGDAAALDRLLSERGYEYAVGPGNNEAILEATSRPQDVVVVMWGEARKVIENRAAVAARRREVVALVACDLWHVGERLPTGEPEHGFRWNFGTGAIQLWRAGPTSGLTTLGP